VTRPATRLNVRRISVPDAWEAAHVLAASHLDYPAFEYAFPAIRQRERVVRHLMAAAARDVERRGVGYLARTHGLAAGSALWFPPGALARGGWDAVQEYMRQHNSTLFSVMLTSDENDRWIEQLNKRADEGIFWLFLIKTDPIFDPLRGDPRFQALVRKFDPPQ